MSTSQKLFTVAEAIAHTNKTIEAAGNRLQKKVQTYSLSHAQNENDFISR